MKDIERVLDQIFLICDDRPEPFNFKGRQCRRKVVRKTTTTTRNRSTFGCLLGTGGGGGRSKGMRRWSLTATAVSLTRRSSRAPVTIAAVDRSPVTRRFRAAEPRLCLPHNANICGTLVCLCLCVCVSVCVCVCVCGWVCVCSFTECAWFVCRGPVSFVCLFVFWFLKRKSGGCHRWNPFGGGKSKKLRNWERTELRFPEAGLRWVKNGLAKVMPSRVTWSYVGLKRVSFGWVGFGALGLARLGLSWFRLGSLRFRLGLG